MEEDPGGEQPCGDDAQRQQVGPARLVPECEEDRYQHQCGGDENGGVLIGELIHGCLEIL